jgi:integrase/recombinase XerC
MPQARTALRRRARDWKPNRPAASISATGPWDAAVNSFLLDVHARNCSPATLDIYRWNLTGPRIRQFIADYGIKDVGDVTPDKLRGFQADLRDAGLAPSTVSSFHRVLRTFLGFCEQEGYNVPPESLRQRGPIQPITEPEAFSETEERQLLDACRCERDRMLVQFMLHTGLRRSEVINVKLDDIVLGADGAYVKVRQGKGRKDRIVPLDTPHENFSKKLTRYIRMQRPRETRSEYLWLSTRENPVTGDYDPLNVEGLKMIFRRLSEITGIHTHAHKFRHTFATRALAAGVDSLVLQRALGHTTLAMVNRYVHFQSNDLLRAWQARRD